MDVILELLSEGVFVAMCIMYLLAPVYKSFTLFSVFCNLFLNKSTDQVELFLEAGVINL